jgi:hypothetical protein
VISTAENLCDLMPHRGNHQTGYVLFLSHIYVECKRSD